MFDCGLRVMGIRSFNGGLDITLSQPLIGHPCDEVSLLKERKEVLGFCTD